MQTLGLQKKDLLKFKNFGKKTYSEIDTISNKMELMQKAGYLPVATFILPESVRLNYYAVTRKLQKVFLEKYKNNKAVEEFIASQRYESELYDRFKEYYGYVFFIGQKI